MSDPTAPGYVELPNGKSARIIAEPDLSERACRLIDEAMLAAGSTTAAVVAAGLDPDTATLQQIYDVLGTDARNSLRNYHAALIVNMVWEWDVQEHLPTLDSVVDITRPTFAALAKACNEEYNKSVTFVQSEKTTADPKADGGS